MDNRKKIPNEEKMPNPETNKNAKRAMKPTGDTFSQKKKTTVTTTKVFKRAAPPSLPIDLLAKLPGDTVLYPNRPAQTPAPSPVTSRTNPVITTQHHDPLPTPRSYLPKIKETTTGVIPPVPTDDPPPLPSLEQAFHIPKVTSKIAGVIPPAPTDDPPPPHLPKVANKITEVPPPPKDNPPPPKVETTKSVVIPPTPKDNPPPLSEAKSIPTIVVQPPQTSTSTNNEILNKKPNSQISAPQEESSQTLKLPIHTPKIRIPSQDKVQSTPPLNVTQTVKKPASQPSASNKSSPSGSTIVREEDRFPENITKNELDEIYDEVIDKKPLVVDDTFKKVLEDAMRIHKESFYKKNPNYIQYGISTNDQPTNMVKEDELLDEIKTEGEDLIEMPVISWKEKKKPSRFSFFCCCTKDSEPKDDVDNLISVNNFNNKRGRYSPR